MKTVKKGGGRGSHLGVNADGRDLEAIPVNIRLVRDMPILTTAIVLAIYNRTAFQLSPMPLSLGRDLEISS